MKYKKILSIALLALSASLLPFYGISKDVKDTNRMLTSNILDENNVGTYVSVKSNETKAVQDTSNSKDNSDVKTFTEEDLKKVTIKDHKVEREREREDNNAPISNKGLIDHLSGKFNIWLGASYTPSADVKNFTDNNIGDKYKYALTAGIGYDLFIKNVFNENITPFVGIGLNGTYRFDNLTFKDFKFNTQLNANLRLGMQFKINSKVSIRPYGLVGVSTQNVKIQKTEISHPEATYQAIKEALPEGYDIEKLMHFYTFFVEDSWKQLVNEPELTERDGMMQAYTAGQQGPGSNYGRSYFFGGSGTNFDGNILEVHYTGLELKTYNIPSNAENGSYYEGSHADFLEPDGQAFINKIIDTTGYVDTNYLDPFGGWIYKYRQGGPYADNRAVYIVPDSFDVPDEYRQVYNAILNGNEVETDGLIQPHDKKYNQYTIKEALMLALQDQSQKMQTKKIVNEVDWKIGLNAGVGIDVVINDRFIVGGEYLYNLINNLETHNVGLKFGYQF